MAVTIESLGIDKLSVDERVLLVGDIMDSIAADEDLTDAQRAELELRLADDDANPDDTVPWEQVAEEAAARWSK